MKLISLYEFDNEDKELLLRYWEAYHAQFIPISYVKELRIMQQKFTNNKSKESYEHFGYFTLINQENTTTE